MESYNSHIEQNQEEDTLSLCNLLLEHNQEEPPPPPPPTKVSDPDDFFTFPVDLVYGYYPMDILFCGKSINPSSSNPKKQLNSLESFKLGHCPSGTDSHINHVTHERKSMRSKSSKSHKHLIGLVKYHQQEMDLNEMRKRQGRRALVAMFPGKVDGEKLPEVKNEELGVVTTTRPLSCRSHLLSALAKAALGCIPHV